MKETIESFSYKAQDNQTAYEIQVIQQRRPRDSSFAQGLISDGRVQQA